MFSDSCWCKQKLGTKPYEKYIFRHIFSTFPLPEQHSTKRGAIKHFPTNDMNYFLLNMISFKFWLNLSRSDLNFFYYSDQLHTYSKPWTKFIMSLKYDEHSFICLLICCFNESKGFQHKNLTCTQSGLWAQTRYKTCYDLYAEKANSLISGKWD